MSDSPSFIRKNLVSLLSSVCVLLLIGNYIFFQIPNNRKRLDNEYYKKLGHLRDNIEMANANLTKSVLANKSNYKDSFCYSNELHVAMRMIPDSIKLKINGFPENDISFGCATVYQKSFHCEAFECIALADPINKKLYYHTGKREPNLQLIFKKNGDLDYFERDTIYSDLRYYVHTFTPTAFTDEIAIIIAVKKTSYESQARAFNLPKTMFVLMLLLLFALLLPLLKSVTATRYENLAVSDVVLSTSAIGTMSVLAIIIIMSYGIYYYFNQRDETQLTQVKQSLKQNFETELNAYGVVTKELDSTIKKGDTLSEMFSRQYAKNPGLSYLFSKRTFRFYKINEKGREVQNFLYHDPSHKNKIYSYNDFSDRYYFKYQQDYPHENKLYFEPLTAWKDRSFRISISKKTKNTSSPGSVHCSNPFISVLTFWPLSNTYFCLPKDFAFAVIDKEGKVQMHSDSTRNLEEDFFEETENPIWLKKEMTIVAARGEVHENLYHGAKNAIKMSGLDLKNNANPLFLVILKNKTFSEKLLVYSVIITLIISFCYNVLIIIISYIISAIYYARHVRMISFYHFNWMFPNEQNKKKYKSLAVLNIIMALLIIPFSFYYDYSRVFFSSISLALFLVFVHFIILAKKYSWNNKERLGLLIFLALIPVIILFISCAFGDEKYILKLAVEMLLCIAYLRHLRYTEIKRTPGVKKINTAEKEYIKEEINNTAKPAKRIHEEGSTRTSYNFFMTSVLGIHYIFIPMLVFISVIYCEKDRADYFIKTSLIQQENNIPKELYKKVPLNFSLLQTTKNLYYDPTCELMFEALLKSITLYELPSRDYIASFEKTPPVIITDKKTAYLSTRIKHVISFNPAWVIVMLISIGALFILLYILLSNFSQRFFFFDLREAAEDLHPFPAVESYPRQESFTNALVFPLYKDLDQKQVYNMENAAFIESKALAGILDVKGDKYPDYTWRLEMAILLIKQQNEKLYSQEMEKLKPIEQFVLIDLAKDNFVNYINKDILISLIQKGLVVSDPVTGHIKVISKAFRLYLLEWEKENPTSFDQKKTETQKLINWKIPVLIMVVATGIFLTYADLDFNKSLLSFIGAFVTVLGLVLKFTGDMAGKIK